MKYTEKQKEAVLKLVSKSSAYQVARDKGISYLTLVKWAREAGVPTSTSGLGPAPKAQAKPKRGRLAKVQAKPGPKPKAKVAEPKRRGRPPGKAKVVAPSQPALRGMPSPEWALSTKLDHVARAIGSLENAIRGGLLVYVDARDDVAREAEQESGQEQAQQ